MYFRYLLFIQIFHKIRNSYLFPKEDVQLYFTIKNNTDWENMISFQQDLS